MESLPPLTSLLAFEAVYRTGSVTAAAARLGRTHGAVSKQLQQLREHAGVELFRKRGSGLEFTSQGRAFARTVAAALDEIRAGYGELSRQKGHRPVTVLASATFARAWLIPVLSRFNIDHPEVDVALQMVGPGGSRGYFGEADLTFSYDRLLSPERWHGSISLGDVEIGPVLAPNYPHSLKDGVLAFQTRIERRNNEKSWKAWSRLSGISVSSQKQQVFDHSYLAFQAARSGMGAVMAPRFLISGMLESGELIAPAGFLMFEGGLVVRPTAAAGTPANADAMILLDWLKANASP
ncbi:MAG: LysR family transcriptional regulator [Hoeflea sp.]|uniref:LysR family transcriptional regulator n=1 Tax=Hoeflea sp. TaxID=1940281 RepID=UPI0032ECCAB0